MRSAERRNGRRGIDEPETMSYKEANAKLDDMGFFEFIGYAMKSHR